MFFLIILLMSVIQMNSVSASLPDAKTLATRAALLSLSSCNQSLRSMGSVKKTSNQTSGIIAKSEEKRLRRQDDNIIKQIAALNEKGAIPMYYDVLQSNQVPADHGGCREEYSYPTYNFAPEKGDSYISPFFEVD